MCVSALQHRYPSQVARCPAHTVGGAANRVELAGVEGMPVQSAVVRNVGAAQPDRDDRRQGTGDPGDAGPVRRPGQRGEPRQPERVPTRSRRRGPAYSARPPHDQPRWPVPDHQPTTHHRTPAATNRFTQDPVPILVTGRDRPSRWTEPDRARSLRWPAVGGVLHPSSTACTSTLRARGLSRRYGQMQGCSAPLVRGNSCGPVAASSSPISTSTRCWPRPVDWVSTATRWCP